MESFKVSEKMDYIPVKSYELVSDTLVKSALEKDKGKDAELLSFEVKPFTNKGDNYACVISEVLVRYRLDGSEFDVSYVAKLNPLRIMAGFTEVLEEMFGRETDMFSTIVGGMNKQLEKLELPPLKTPKLFSQCLEKGKEGFLTENLRVQGFKMHGRTKGMDLDHCTLVMKELGRFHASSLLFEETLYPKTIPESFEYFKEAWLDSNNDSFKIFDTMMISQVDSACSFLKKAGSNYEKCEKWITNHRHEMTKILLAGYKPHEPFAILSHGDCWTNNLLFKYNEDNKPIDIRFVDLQCSRRASPASDLNYFFFSSLNGELRSTKRDIMIQTYYNSFREVLERSAKKVPFSLQELREEVKNGNLYGLCCAILILPLILAEGDEIFDFDNCSEEKLDEFLKTHRQKYEKLTEKEAYKTRFLAVFDEMMDRNIFDQN